MLNFDVLLVAKRKHRLDEIRKHYRHKKWTLEEAARRIFPLIVLRASPHGVSKLRGNETYIRNLYHRRWLLEIEFRQMNLFGYSVRLLGRDARLSYYGVKALLYSIWQTQRYLFQDEYPGEILLQFDEFLGKKYIYRYFHYIPSYDELLHN